MKPKTRDLEITFWIRFLPTLIRSSCSAVFIQFVWGDTVCLPLDSRTPSITRS